jgi:signal peptidase I
MLRRLFLGLVVSVGGLTGTVVVLTVVLTLTGVVHLYKIPSSSMEPTLHCARPGTGCTARFGDRVVVVRYVLVSPARGDLVAFHTPAIVTSRCGAGGVFIKRIVGLPGERVAERAGFFYVDGKRLAEPFVPANRRQLQTIAPVLVPPGSYYVAGDNRSASCDSRVWGTVPRQNLVGRVVATYWPPGRLGIH